MFRTRLTHLMLTEPLLTWEKFNQDRMKLYLEISDTVDRALKYKNRLAGSNLLPGGANELAYNYVAPLDVPEAEEQLTGEQQQQLMEWGLDPPEKDRNHVISSDDVIVLPGMEGSGVTDANGAAVIYTTAEVKKPSNKFCVDNVANEKNKDCRFENEMRNEKGRR